MKKFGFIIFLAALTIGSMSAINCSIGSFKFSSGVKGSGNVKSEIRDAVDFKKIEAGGAVRIFITAQKDFSVEISADDNILPLIKTEVSGDTLKIYSNDRISPKNEIRVNISLPMLENLDISGASGAEVTNVTADQLKLEASGASKIKIDGTSKSLNGDASGASSIDAENLKTEDADVEASGASKITVSPTGNLKADASGASNVYYTGEPRSVEKKSSGASSVKQK